MWVCATVVVSLQESGLPAHHVGPGKGTLATRLHDKHLYHLSHLSYPQSSGNELMAAVCPSLPAPLPQSSCYTSNVLGSVLPQGLCCLLAAQDRLSPPCSFQVPSSFPRSPCLLY